MTAEQVFEKIQKAPTRLAVFNIAGTLKTTRYESDLYASSLRKYPQKLIGIYDKRIRYWDLKDDIEYSVVALA